MNYSKEDDLLIQTYLTTEFLFELSNLKFLESPYYKNANFLDKSVHQFLPTIGIGNRGALLMTLYSLLIVPKELIEKKYRKEFRDLNIFVGTIKSDVNTTYEKDTNSVDYIRHIRNAVAHANMEFTSENEVVFLDHNKYYDEKKKLLIIEDCSITIPLVKIDLLINQLKKIFAKHIEKLKIEMLSKK